MAERSIEQDKKEGEADGEDDEGEKSMNLGMMERVDRVVGTVRVVFTTATTSLLGQVGRKAIMGPRNDR